MHAAAELAPEDWALWRDFSAMRSTVERALEQRVQRDASISVADFDVLRGLSEAEGGRLRAGALAEALGWEKSRISHQVRRMADRRLLERAGCPSDGRGTWVVLADAGCEALAAASCGYAEVLREALFDRLQADERRTLRRMTDRVHETSALVRQPSSDSGPLTAVV